MSIISTANSRLNAAALHPPVAPVKEHSDVRHGETVSDDYFWLREKSNPEVIQYLEAENAYTEAVTKELRPFADSLYAEMLSHIKQTDLSVPAKRGDYLYYARTEEGKQYPIQCRRKGSMEAPEEILLDLNVLGQGKAYIGLDAFALSDDQNLLAYTLDYTGFRQYTLQIKDLRTGQVLEGTAEALNNLYHDPQRRQQLAQAAFEAAQNPDYSWEAIAERFDRLFGELTR